MKKLLQFLIESIVTVPEKVKVSEKNYPDLVVLSVQADPQDLKLIIGKHGRTIKALRELVKVKAVFSQKRIQIEVKN